MNTKGLTAALFFGVVVTLIPFVTKNVLSVYNFGYPFVSLAARNLMGIIIIETLRMLGLVKVAPYSLKRATNTLLLLVTILNAFQALSVGVALKTMSIPMFGALRQTAPLVSLILLVVFFKKPMPPFLVTFSVGLITTGCLIAGYGDLSFDAAAYTAGMLSVISLSLHQILVQKAIGKGYSVADTFQVECYNIFFFCTVGAIVTGEWQAVQHYSYLRDSNFLIAFTLFLIVGNLLNFSVNLCTSINGALTTSLVGVLKNVPQTFIGYVSFGGVKFHHLNVLGLGLNMVGAFLFTYAKYKDPSHEKIS